MPGSGVIEYTRQRLERVWSSRLSVPLRPASAGPVRYWQDQVRLAVKAAIAAVGEWALARYAVGQPDPYFAPLAAFLGVYPTVARSLRKVSSTWPGSCWARPWPSRPAWCWGRGSRASLSWS